MCLKIIPGIVLTILLMLSSSAHSTPDYALRTGQGCTTCHAEPGGTGGALNETGLGYAASGYAWPPGGGYRVLGPVRRPVRLFVGFLHILAAFLWFGTILYVHILLRPGYASKGLPRGEVLLGLVSMGVVAVTGVLLTVSRVNSLEVLYTSRWGLLLLAKIILYLVMVSSAIIVVTLVGPRLRRAMKKARLPKGGVFDPVTLSGFDGKEGRPAYIAFEGRVYDVSALNLWEGGGHMRQHSAGEDLTGALARAPHGAEKLDGIEAVGVFDATVSPEKTPAQKAFYAVAYSNLFLVFVVLFVIALWRWGI